MKWYILKQSIFVSSDHQLVLPLACWNVSSMLFITMGLLRSALHSVQSWWGSVQGTDSTAANTSKQRLNEKELKWVFWMWCLAQTWNCSLRQFNRHSFDSIDEMLYVKKSCLKCCALFVDLLNPCATFSTGMQADEIHILGVLMSLLSSLKVIVKLTVCHCPSGQNIPLH